MKDGRESGRVADPVPLVWQADRAVADEALAEVLAMSPFMVARCLVLVKAPPLPGTGGLEW